MGNYLEENYDVVIVGAGHAQKVVSENGKVIIDSSAIPHVTTKKATR